MPILTKETRLLDFNNKPVGAVRTEAVDTQRDLISVRTSEGYFQFTHAEVRAVHLHLSKLRNQHDHEKR